MCRPCLTVARWDCININNEPVGEDEFLKVENHYKQLSERENIGASEFEILTATAFTLFNEKKVDVGVVEVGMGGKLDATNILNNQVVSIISKIALDHQGFLGNTLGEIALHKAGILRPNVPFLVNPMNEFNVHQIIEEYAQEIGAGPRILLDTEELHTQVYKTRYWKDFSQKLIPFQRDNALIALLAYLEVLKSLGLNVKILQATHMLDKMRNKRTLPGRMHEVSVVNVFGKPHRILVDGAHNPDAAHSLENFVERKLRKPRSDDDVPRPVTWVLAMTEGKDPRQFLKTLLWPGDNVVTTSFGPVDGMPWVKSMDPTELQDIAREVCPDITALAVPKRGVHRALCTAKYLTGNVRDPQYVLTGSLYLVGDFFREHESVKEAMKQGERYPVMRNIDLDEQARVRRFLDELAGSTQDTSITFKDALSGEGHWAASPKSVGTIGAAEEKSKKSEVYSPPATSASTAPLLGGSENLDRLRTEIAELEREMRYLQGHECSEARSFPPEARDLFQHLDDFSQQKEPQGGRLFKQERGVNSVPVRRLRGKSRSGWSDVVKETEARVDRG